MRVLGWHEWQLSSAPQLNYADMLKRVEPLRNELQKLEDDAKDNQQKANEVEQMIRDLEASIARYKEEYAVLISEAQAIKADLAAVEAKVSQADAALAVSRQHTVLLEEPNCLLSTRLRRINRHQLTQCGASESAPPASPCKAL